jgi:hypothetical protein
MISSDASSAFSVKVRLAYLSENVEFAEFKVGVIINGVLPLAVKISCS